MSTVVYLLHIMIMYFYLTYNNVCMHIPAHTCTHLHIPAHTCTHLHTPAHTCTHLHTCAHVLISPPLPTHTPHTHHTHSSSQVLGRCTVDIRVCACPGRNRDVDEKLLDQRLCSGRQDAQAGVMTRRGRKRGGCRREECGTWGWREGRVGGEGGEVGVVERWVWWRE